jgi:DNA-binding MarR family transcriptional regulator
MLEELRKVDSEMPLQMAATFMTVANEEGITMKLLGEKLGISQSSCSRNVAALSKFHRLNKPGHDLLYATEDPEERRRKIVKLTPKGKRVAESLLEILEA